MQEKNKIQLSTQNSTCIVISGTEGSGVTHTIKSICQNQQREKGKTLYLSTTYFSNEQLLPINRKKILHELSQCTLLAIDNLQNWYKIKKRAVDFLITLSYLCLQRKTTLLLGCSDEKKDITRSTEFGAATQHSRIRLKNPSYGEAVSLLKFLCEYENNIPKNIPEEIASFNGTYQQYINCLIHIRFQSKIKGVNLFALSKKERSEIFGLKYFFTQSQLRKAFIREWCEFNR